MSNLEPAIATDPLTSPKIDLDFTPVANLMHDEAEAGRFGGVALVVKGNFTVVAIGQIVELALVSLEDSITKFLPEHVHRLAWASW